MYVFATPKVKAVLTPNENYLDTIYGKIDSLKVNKPIYWEQEVKRMEMAAADVLTRMTPAEIQNFHNRNSDNLSASEKEAIRKREESDMNLNNKDKNSI